MAELYLRLLEDRFAPSDDLVYLPALNRALHVVDGSLWAETFDGGQRLEAGAGTVQTQALTLAASGVATTLWRWELDTDRAVCAEPRSAPRVATRCLIEQRLDLPRGHTWLMRCDRVAIPAAQIAFMHVHQGPGIRCTLHGSFRVDTQGATHVHRPGDAWFETGIDPVTAHADSEIDSDFARCLILPASCKGRSSVRYVNDDDLRKPKPQTYTVFAERLVTLPDA